MITQTMMTHSTELELREPQGSYALKVIELYKIANNYFYNLDKWVYQICSDLVGIDEPILKQALVIYEKSRDKKKPEAKPHPSYFVKVAKRLAEEASQAPKDNSPKINLGKMI